MPTSAVRSKTQARSARGLALLLALSLAACGGSILDPGDGGLLPDSGNPDSGTSDSGSPDSGPGPDGGMGCGGGVACSSDNGCLPPILICGAEGCCTLGCSRTGCPGTLVCGPDGHCTLPDFDGGAPDAGGPDAGPRDGGVTDGGPKPDGGPSDGGPKPDGGPSDGGPSDAGPVDSSGNPNGCGQCEPCKVSEDCHSGAICANGQCANSCFGRGAIGNYFCSNFGAPASTCLSWPDLSSSGGFLDPGYCFPQSGSCQLSDGGAPSCIPAGPSSACAGVTPPSAAAPTAVPMGVSLASAGASLTRDSTSYLGALLVQDSDGDTRVRIVSTFGFDTSNWDNLGRVTSTLTQARGTPSLVVTRWTDAGGSHERYVVAYTRTETYAAGDGGTTTGTAVYVYYSDNAATWTGQTGSAGETDAAEPILAAGPAGALVLGYTAGGKTWLRSGSSQHGMAWGSAAAIPTVSRPALAFDPSDTAGNTLVLAGNLVSTSASGVSVARSRDRGQTWSTAYTVASGAAITSERPALAIAGPTQIYVGASAASAQSPQSLYPDPIVYRVDASGTSLAGTGGTVVSDTKGGCFQHRTLSLAVDSGTLWAAFSDDRDSGRGNVWVSSSKDQGLTWTSNARATSQSYFYDWGSSAGLRSIGPVGLFASGGKAILLWSDPGDGAASLARATSVGQ